MSFILKALKKVEKEKAAARTESVDISSALLTPDRPPHSSARTFSFWLRKSLYFAVVAAILLIFWLKYPSPVSGPDRRPPRPVQSSQPINPVATPARGEKPSLPAETVVHEETLPKGREAVHPAVPTPEAHPQAKKDRERIAEAPPESKPAETRLSEAEPALSAAPSSIILNGIALQDDPSQSIAVVNGQILKKGMYVGDAKVERIYLDKVRFRGSNGMFEVHLAR